jgi:hypothetical protein
MLSSAWDGVSELFEKGKNWVQGEGFNSNKEIAVDAALAAFHEMGVQEAIQSALQEFGTQQAQEVLKSFYNDSKEVTEAKVWALKEAGYDTTKLEAAIAKRRQAIEEGKQLEAEKNTVQNNTTQEQMMIVRVIDSVYSVIQKGVDVLEETIFGKGKDNTIVMSKNTSLELEAVNGSINPDRMKDLTLALNQGEPLKNILEELKQEGMIPNDVDVKQLAKNGCVYASLYVDLAMAGAGVEDIESFIARWYKEEAIAANGTTYQDVIAKAYGFELKRITNYNEFVKVMSNGNGLQNGIIRFYSEKLQHEHNINLYSNNGGWYASDVGAKKNHGKSWTDLIKEKRDFRYFQILNKQ